MHARVALGLPRCPPIAPLIKPKVLIDSDFQWRPPPPTLLPPMRKQDIQRLLNATLIEEEVSKSRAELERLKAQNDRLEKDVAAFRQTEEDPPQDIFSVKATSKAPTGAAEAQGASCLRVRATSQAFRVHDKHAMAKTENDFTSARW